MPPDFVFNMHKHYYTKIAVLVPRIRFNAFKHKVLMIQKALLFDVTGALKEGMTL
jgi:hypothetical protein